MNISLNKIGRRFNREWIFKNVDYSFQQGESYAILGANGSGKSTLLQVLNGSLTPSAGEIIYSDGVADIVAENIHRHLSLAAPYLEVIEDFSLNEMIDFHFKFKPYKAGINKQVVTDILNFKGSQNKLIKHFSSGMKQRLKLALAFCADTPLLMLDEPTSNLDNQGIDWYLGLIEQFSSGRLTIICSNQQHEYSFCKNHIRIADYKS